MSLIEKLQTKINIYLGCKKLLVLKSVILL